MDMVVSGKWLVVRGTVSREAEACGSSPLRRIGRRGAEDGDVEQNRVADGGDLEPIRAGFDVPAVARIAQEERPAGRDLDRVAGGAERSVPLVGRRAAHHEVAGRRGCTIRIALTVKSET